MQEEFAAVLKRHAIQIFDFERKGNKMRAFRAALILLLLTFVASATIINFSSDLISEGNDITTNNVAITPVSVWALAPWVSYTNTGAGAGSSSPPNTTIGGTPTAVFWESITLPYGDNSGWIRAWADDTMSVIVYNSLYPGGLLLHPANNVPSPHCVGQPIGCVEGMGGILTLDNTVLAQGLNTFSMPTYQLWGDGFGAAWEGQVNSTPEPMTFVLIGTGLVALGLSRRWRKKASG